MPIISRAETRSRRGKLVLLAIVAVLSLGGVTMVYPFLLMLSGSMRSQMDEASLNLIPSFLFSDKALYRRFLETKYDQDVGTLNRDSHQHAYTFSDAAVPPRLVRRRITDFRAFVRQSKIPFFWWVLGGTVGYQTTPGNLRALRARLEQRFHGHLRAFSRAVGSPTSAWDLITPGVPQWLSQRFSYRPDAIWAMYFQMFRQSPLAQRDILSITGYFLQTVIAPAYGLSSVAAYNQAHVRPIRSFRTFVLPRRVPSHVQPLLREEWIDFVRGQLNPSFVGLKGVSTASWQEWLRQRYRTLAALNGAWRTRFTAFDAVALPQGRWLSGAKAQDYLAFLDRLSPAHYRLLDLGYAWRDWLRRHYRHSIAALNAAGQTRYRRFSQARIPMAELEYSYVRQHALALRWRYATRNYVNVLDGMLFQGRALLNTAIYCLLAILAALVVNPLAAYALSRFRLRGTYKILLILMATMAFPPMVTMIPNFIILRQLHLLNTFAALILPAIANGYMIFLLKGFFDSLPPELYEAARLDGASELRLFVQLTLALSQPILAWVTLGAFTAAYTNFLGALIVCPAQHMWTISVWLYQFEQQANPPAVYAAVLIASIPTFLVFLLAQRTIIRGIVVPVEK